ncbi:aldo/keto reductase [Spirosoma radiotolerans]|uniref:Aldo/keto reductase n=1 Tax=Spirosoma radiotolerans TaxID=1379870 RepID=A0A0E3ZYV9_9BACT|nr:aldo/keto reductase [Spirosoma radiotolerans]AKD57250.1 aldo/keto reductase [Spirosoma radiotolerans]
MKTVELVSGIKSSALGFGCAPILGSVDKVKAQRALDCALDCGITHLDLARSYGYGEAEEFVGKRIKGRRDRVVLASKFGVQANWKAALFRPVKPLVRVMLDTWRRQSSPEKITLTSNKPTSVADRFHDRIPLRAMQMRQSLEKSLRALNTDYLDYFFIHEPQEDLIYFDELALTAEQLKREGKIRAWGLAYFRSQEPIHKAYLSNFDVLQFDNSPGSPGYDHVVAERGSRANILFSPLSGGTKTMTPSEKLNKLFEDFPNSVVLCSMFNQQHLKNNIESIRSFNNSIL